MLAILNYLNVHNLPIFQPMLMIFVSKSMVHRALSDKTYLSLGLLSPFRQSEGNSFSASNGILINLHMHHHTIVIYKFHENPSIAC